MPKGSIRRRPDRGPTAWQARWYVGRDERGRQRTLTRSFEATTKREAERMATKILAELEAQADAEQSERGTVAEYARKWLRRKERELSPTTIQFGYATIVARIVARFGRMQLVDVQPEHVREWYGELADMGLSGRTVERHHQVLRAMYRDARDDRKVTDLPTSFRRQQLPKSKVVTPTIEQVRTAIDAASGEFRRLLVVLAASGMRRGEVCGLRWEDVEPGPEVNDAATLLVQVRRSVAELKGGKLAVKSTKTDAERTVLLIGEPVAVLLEQYDELAARLKRTPRPDEYVFPALGGGPRRPGWVTQNWRRLRARRGLDAVRLHDLRHFHATHLLAQGVPIGEVSRRLGHSQVSTTLNIYGHSTAAGEIEAAKAARFDA